MSQKGTPGRPYTRRVAAKPKASRTSADIGDVVGTYRLTGLIGHGGMGTVFRSHDERLDREVAVKLLSATLSADENFRLRFQRESKVAASFHHPNIVPVFDAGEWKGQLYLAMMLIDGPNLATVIAHEAPMPLRRVAGIVSQVASALDAAHAMGNIHRDVKPANILLLERPAAGRPEHAYLVDFGLTRSAGAVTQMTRVGTFVGTLDYIAPEQLQGETVDGRADQYSLACTAYQMLAGTPPFKRESEVALISAHLYAPVPSLSSIRPDLPKTVSRVLAKAMAKDPDDRFRTTGEFADALGQAAIATPAQPNTIAAGSIPPPVVQGVVRNRPREETPASHRAMAIGLGVVLLALAVGLGAVLALGLPRTPQRTGSPGPTNAAIGVGPTDTPFVPTAGPTDALPTLGPTPTLLMTPPPVTVPPVTAPPFPWQVIVTAAPTTTLDAGQYVTIYVTLNARFADAAAAGLAVQVYSSEHHKFFDCPQDSEQSCSFRGHWPDSHVTTYVAIVGPPGGSPISQSQVQVTWLAATPAPTPALPPGAPELGSDYWFVTHTFDYFEDGYTANYDSQQTRSYTLSDYSCYAAYDCTAQFITNIGSSPKYHWDGSNWTSGPTNYVGSRKCGDVPDGYDVQQTVTVHATAWDAFGRITQLQGEMDLEGFPTPTGESYGCTHFKAVYTTELDAQ